MQKIFFMEIERHNEVERLASSGDNWILIIKSATNVLKGDNYVFIYLDYWRINLLLKKEMLLNLFWEKVN